MVEAVDQFRTVVDLYQVRTFPSKQVKELLIAHPWFVLWMVFDFPEPVQNLIGRPTEEPTIDVLPVCISGETLP